MELEGAANFGGIELCSESGLAFAWPLDPSIRWIPSDEDAHILAFENGAAHLKQRVHAFLAPANVSVALHALADHVVDGILAPALELGWPCARRRR